MTPSPTLGGGGGYGLDRRLFHHGDVVEQVHVRHAAAGVAARQIFLQQRELLARRLGRQMVRSMSALRRSTRFIVRVGANSAATTRTETQAAQPSHDGR